MIALKELPELISCKHVNALKSMGFFVELLFILSCIYIFGVLENLPIICSTWDVGTRCRGISRCLK